MDARPIPFIDEAVATIEGERAVKPILAAAEYHNSRLLKESVAFQGADSHAIVAAASEAILRLGPSSLNDTWLAKLANHCLRKKVLSANI